MTADLKCGAASEVAVLVHVAVCKADEVCRDVIAAVPVQFLASGRAVPALIGVRVAEAPPDWPATDVAGMTRRLGGRTYSFVVSLQCADLNQEEV